MTIDEIKPEMRSCSRCTWAVKDGRPEILNPQGIPFWIPIPEVEFRTLSSMESMNFASMGRKRRKVLLSHGLYPFEPLSDDLLRKLGTIGDTYPGRTPGCARLKKGLNLPRVVFLSEELAVSYFSGFWMHFVRPTHLDDIGPSSEAFPLKIRRSMLGETSMSSLEFVLRMSDGARISGWYSGHNDFVQLPLPYDVDDILACDKGRGLAQDSDSVLIEPEFIYCVYKK